MDERVIQSLVNIIEKYDYHPLCIEDIQILAFRSGNLKRFINIFRKNTEVLEEFGLDAVEHPNFEKLKRAKQLYSMRIKCDKFNIRILYTHNSGKIALLLCCFYEKSGTKETYDKYIPVALERLKEMEE